MKDFQDLGAKVSIYRVNWWGGGAGGRYTFLNPSSFPIDTKVRVQYVDHIEKKHRST